MGRVLSYERFFLVSVLLLLTSCVSTSSGVLQSKSASVIDIDTRGSKISSNSKGQAKTVNFENEGFAKTNQDGRSLILDEKKLEKYHVDSVVERDNNDPQKATLLLSQENKHPFRRTF